MTIQTRLKTNTVCIITYVQYQLQNVLEINLFLRNTKQHNHLSYISFKITPLRNCTLPPMTAKLLETFLEAISRKPFQLFRRILINVSNITKVPSLQCLLQSGEEVKISCSQARKKGNVAMLSHSSLLRNP
jgi:hypothetical protein